MANDGGFLSFNITGGRTFNLKMQNGTQLKLDGKTYEVDNYGKVTSNGKEVTNKVNISQEKAVALLRFANADESTGTGYFDETDMDIIKNKGLTDSSFYSLRKGEIAATTEDGNEYFRISTKKTRADAAKLSHEADRDRAYREKHWFRANILGVSRQEYEKDNKPDY